MKVLQNQEKRCMDCKVWNDQWGDTYCSSGEDQKACDEWEPNLPEKEYNRLKKEYAKNKKALKFFKALWKYMGEQK